MNTNTTLKIIGTASAAAIGISGSWVASPAQATTDAGGDGGTTTTSVEDFGQVLAVRKMAMAHDYVANAADRAGFAARAATGGSVDEQQVPSGPPAAYLPGGSVYEQQVPTTG